MIKLIFELLFAFIKIGLFTFGGGYASIPIIQSDIVENYHWISYEDFLTFVGISEATPGPFAINIATFIGSSRAGILGSLAATLGFVIPSFVIILIIAILANKFNENKYVKGVIKGIAPVTVGLVFASGISIFVKNLIIVDNVFSPDITGIGIMLDLLLISFLYKKKKGRKISPIFLIVIAAILGIIVY